MSDFKLVYFTDDDHEDLSLLQEISGSLGHTAEIFLNPLEMLTLLKSELPKPDLIFLDLRMPNVDGYEVLETLRKQPDFDKIPIIIHSSNCDEKCIQRCLELGADKYITKASTISEMRAAVDHVISKDWTAYKATSADFLYQH